MNQKKLLWLPTRKPTNSKLLFIRIKNIKSNLQLVLTQHKRHKLITTKWSNITTTLRDILSRLQSPPIIMWVVALRGRNLLKIIVSSHHLIGLRWTIQKLVGLIALKIRIMVMGELFLSDNQRWTTRSCRKGIERTTQIIVYSTTIQILKMNVLCMNQMA